MLAACEHEDVGREAPDDERCLQAIQADFLRIRACQQVVWSVAIGIPSERDDKLAKESSGGLLESASERMSVTISCSSGAPLSSGIAATSTPVKSVREKVTARSGRIIAAVVRTSHGIIIIPCHGAAGLATTDLQVPMIAMPED